MEPFSPLFLFWSLVLSTKRSSTRWYLLRQPSTKTKLDHNVPGECRVDIARVESISCYEDTHSAYEDTHIARRRTSTQIRRASTGNELTKGTRSCDSQRIFGVLTILLWTGRPLLHLPRRWHREPRCCDTCPHGLLRWSAPRLLQRRGLQLLHQRLHVSVIHHLWLLQWVHFRHY